MRTAVIKTIHWGAFSMLLMILGAAMDHPPGDPWFGFTVMALAVAAADQAATWAIWLRGDRTGLRPTQAWWK